MVFTPYLITLAHLRRHRSLAAAQTDDDVLLAEFVLQASANLITQIFRIPHPYLETKQFDYMQSNLLNVGDDLLSITTLTNGDGTTVAPSSYNLMPLNQKPHYMVKMKTGYSFNYIDSRDAAIEIEGEWGYVPHYLNCWEQVTLLNGAITSTANTLVVDSATDIEVGHYLKIGSEQFRVTSVSSSTIGIKRGQAGTTAAIQADNAPVSVYLGVPDLQQAVCDYAAYLYKNKDSMAGRVNVYDHGTVRSQGKDPELEKIISLHSRKAIVG